MQQAQLPVTLTSTERRHLRRVMARHLELDELKDLAFDLGAEYTVFCQDSMRASCRELVAWHERRDRVRCLVAAVLDRTQEKGKVLQELLTRLPACRPWTLLQLTLEEKDTENVGTQFVALAEALDVTPGEITLVTAVRGNVRLLVGAPVEAADASAIADAATPVTGKSFTPFEALDALDRHAWRWVAQTWPPTIVGSALQPVASWEEALDAMRANLMREGIQMIEDGQSSAQASQYAQAAASLERALEIARELGDGEMEAAVLGHLGNTHYAQGQVELAIDSYRQALAVARETADETGDRRAEGIHLGNLGVAYYAQGQTQAAIAYYQRALPIARAASDLYTEGSLLGNLGLAYDALTQIAQSSSAAHSTAVDFYQQALAIAREVGDRRAEGTLLGHLGDAYRGMGQAPGAGDNAVRRANLYTAADTYHRALVVSRETGDRTSEGDLLCRLGNTYLGLGELGDRNYRTAIDHYQQALAIAREVGDRRGEGARLGNLGSTFYALGQLSQALDTYQQALAIARETGDRKGEGVRLGNLGNAYYALATTQGENAACAPGARPGSLNTMSRDRAAVPDGSQAATSVNDLYAALDAYQQALAIARETGDRRAERIHLGHLGLVYSALGELARAPLATGRAPLADPLAVAEDTLAADQSATPRIPSLEGQELLEEISQPEGVSRPEGISRPEDIAQPEEFLRAAIEAYEQALSIAREAGDRKAEGLNLGRLGDAYSALGQVPGARPRDQRPAAARECYRQALSIAREVGDRKAEAHHLGHLGSVYSTLGEQEQAIASLEQALIIAREIGDRPAEAAHLGSLGTAYSAFGQDGRARAYFQQAVSVAHDLGDRRCEGNWLGDLGSTYSATGQYEQAVRCYSRALEIAREIGDWQNEATWLGNLGNAYVALREVQQGVDAYQEALDIVREAGIHGGQSVRGQSVRDKEGLLGNLGNAYSIQRQWDKAVATYEGALETARATGNRRGEGIWLLNLGLALDEQGDRDEAILRVTAARDVLEAAGSPEAAQAMATLEQWTENA